MGVLGNSKMDFVGESDILYFPVEYGETDHITITCDRENGLELYFDE